MATQQSWRAVESAIGLLAVFFISYVMPVFVVLGVVRLGDQGISGFALHSLCGMAAAGALVSSIWITYTANRSIKICYPDIDKGAQGIYVGHRATSGASHVSVDDQRFAIVMAGNLLHTHLIFAPFLSLWWLAHFLLGITMAIGAAFWVSAAFDRPSFFFQIALTHTLAFILSLASNVYLLMAVATLFRRRSVLEFIWRFRIVLDIVVAGIGPSLGFWLMNRGPM